MNFNASCHTLLHSRLRLYFIKKTTAFKYVHVYKQYTQMALSLNVYYQGRPPQGPSLASLCNFFLLLFLNASPSNSPRSPTIKPFSPLSTSQIRPSATLTKHPNVHIMSSSLMFRFLYGCHDLKIMTWHSYKDIKISVDAFRVPLL